MLNLNNKKIFILSSSCLLCFTNIFCSDKITLSKDSYVDIRDYNISLKNVIINKPDISKIKNVEDLFKYFVENIKNVKFVNLDDDSDEDNGKILEDVFKLYERKFKIGIEGQGELYNDKLQFNGDIKNILNSIISTKTLKLILEIPYTVSFDYGFLYRLKKQYYEGLDEINRDIFVKQLSVSELKKLLKSKGFNVDEIKFYDDLDEKKEKKELKDDYIFDFSEIIVVLKDIGNYIEEIKVKVEIKAGDGYELTTEEKLKEYKFTELGINNEDDNNILKILKNSKCFSYLKGKKYEYIYKEDGKIKEVKDDFVFEEYSYILITINDEIEGICKKKVEENKSYINLKFEVTDNNKFKLKDGIKDINNIVIEQNKNYNDLLNIIKQKLNNKDLKSGFKIYKKDKNTEFTSGNLENGETYIVVFADDDNNFVEKIVGQPKRETNKDDNNEETGDSDKVVEQKENTKGCSSSTNVEYNTEDGNTKGEGKCC